MSRYLYLFFGVLMLKLNETPSLAVRCYKCKSISWSPARYCRIVNCPHSCQVKQETKATLNTRTNHYEIFSTLHYVGCYGSLGECTTYRYGTGYTYISRCKRSSCSYNLCNSWPGYEKVRHFATERTTTTTTRFFPRTTTCPNTNTNGGKENPFLDSDSSDDDWTLVVAIIISGVFMSLAPLMIVACCKCNKKYHFVNAIGVWVRRRRLRRQRQDRRSSPPWRFGRACTVTLAHPEREQPNSAPRSARFERRDNVMNVVSEETELAAQRQHLDVGDVARNSSVDSVSHEVASQSTGPPTCRRAAQNVEPPSYGSATQNVEPPSYGSASQNVEPPSYGSATQNVEPPSYGSASQNVEPPSYGSASLNYEPQSSHGNTSQNNGPSSYGSASPNASPEVSPPAYDAACSQLVGPPSYEDVTQRSVTQATFDLVVTETLTV